MDAFTILVKWAFWIFDFMYTNYFYGPRTLFWHILYLYYIYFSNSPNVPHLFLDLTFTMVSLWWTLLLWGITGIQSDNQNNIGTPKIQSHSVLSNYWKTRLFVFAFYAYQFFLWTENLFLTYFSDLWVIHSEILLCIFLY